MSTVKKIPMRKCTGCNEMKEKKAMMRVLKCEEGIVLDTTGKKNGRGAYICPSLKCLKKARKSRRIEQNLECDIPESVYDALEAQLGDE